MTASRRTGELCAELLRQPLLLRLKEIDCEHTLIEQRLGNETASLSNILKTLVQRIQEAMDRAEQGIRVVAILPVSADPNGSQAFRTVQAREHAKV